MPILTERSLIKFGDGGLAITIPIAWARFYGLRAGDRLTLITDGEIKIRLPKPKKSKDEYTGASSEE